MKAKSYVKKMFAAILTAGLIFAAVPLGVLAEETQESALVPVGDVYQITSAADLQWVADQSATETFAGKTIQLQNDIDLSGIESWTPINNFAGTFDGGGYTITGLKVNSPSAPAGLFGNRSGNPVFKNVTISGAAVTGGSYVGALIGDAFTTSLISNCDVVNSNIIGTNFVGGVAGSGYIDLIENCDVLGGSVTGNNVNSQANGDNIGGILGFAGEGLVDIVDCTVNGTDIHGYRKVAGIVGAALYGTTVDGCTVSNATIKADKTYSFLDPFTGGAPSAGGIAGQLTGESTEGGASIAINYCVVNGTTTVDSGDGRYRGWLCGDASTRIKKTAFNYKNASGNNTNTSTLTIPEFGS